MKYGYIRVSRKDQDTSRQIVKLSGICDELHEEKISAVAKKRPVFDVLVEKLVKGDTLVVLDLDRAFRSTIDAIDAADRLKERGIHFKIVNLDVDTTTEAGQLVYTMMAALAQFERKTLVRRTKEGLDAARKRGTKLGRPATSEEKIRLITKMHGEGTNKAEIARALGLHVRTVYRVLSK